MKLLLTVTLALLFCSAVASAEGFGTLQLGIIKPVAPNITLDLGLTGSIGIWTLPEKLPMVGGKNLWADFIYLGTNGMVGGSVPLGIGIPGMDGIRGGVTAWFEGGWSGDPKWSLYLIQPLVTFELSAKRK